MNADYPFYVSPRNRKGIILFFLICLTVIFLPRIVRHFDKPFKISVSKSKIADFEKRRKEYYQKTYYVTQKGLYSNDDLKKIFVIPDILFKLIKDSTFYPIRPTYIKIIEEKSILSPKEIDLNTASESELLAIKGLGAYYAKAIIKYKGELGGYVRKSQLMEIFKMSSESFEKIIPHIHINPSEIRLLNINDATLEEFNAHPYLNWSQANSIFKMRIQKNGFKNINEIKQSHLIDEETYEKLLPYLSI